MPTLTMTKGLPASGKSTWAKEQVDKGKGQVKRVNKDDLRAMIDNGRWSKNNEKMVLSARDSLVAKFLDEGYDVIVDDTNLHPKHEKQLISIVDSLNAQGLFPGGEGPHKFKIQDFTDVSVEECVRRDLKRCESVGPKVIHNMYKQFLKPHTEPLKQDNSLTDAIICDIDGTLAHMDGRSPYDWGRVGEDVLDEAIVDIVRTYDEDAEIILMSGRDGSCMPETMKWLKDNKVPYDKLYMRAPGDQRKDAVIKRELFDQHVRDKYYVWFVLDDRDQMVEAWRDMGLKCLQVEYGDF